MGNAFSPHPAAPLTALSRKGRGESEVPAPASGYRFKRAAGRGSRLYYYLSEVLSVKTFSLSPSEAYVEHRIFDTTPIHLRWATRSEKQKLLNFVRYNRLIDIFLRVSAYSLQNHLRTTVPNMGQIETDELYVAVRNTGQQFVIRVAAQ